MLQRKYRVKEIFLLYDGMCPRGNGIMVLHNTRRICQDSRITMVCVYIYIYIYIANKNGVADPSLQHVGLISNFQVYQQQIHIYPILKDKRHHMMNGFSTTQTI